MATQIPLSKFTRSTNKQTNTKVGKKFIGKRGDWQERQGDKRYCGGKSNKSVLYICMKLSKKNKFNQFFKAEEHSQCYVIPKDPET